MNQRELILKVNQKDVADEIISKCQTYKSALKLCKEVSGLTDDQLSQELDIDPAQWSRIWSSKANFPDDKLIRFMTLCGNLVPLKWLAFQFGHGIQQLKSAEAMERDEERALRLKAEERLETITAFLRDSGFKALRS